MILEGIVTTQNQDVTPNISPMGPLVDERMQQFVLRPYRSSTTYHNLKRTGEGVLHVTDDVLLLARAAVGQPDPMPELRPAERVAGFVIADVCRWYEFRVSSLNDQAERTTIACDVVAAGRGRDFFGFCRAKHAVVEAAILATRVMFLPRDEVRSEFQNLAILVEKTGGPAEREAFAFLSEFIAGRLEQITGAQPPGNGKGPQ